MCTIRHDRLDEKSMFSGAAPSGRTTHARRDPSSFDHGTCAGLRTEGSIIRWIAVMLSRADDVAGDDEAAG
jgi:hypothetical protein